MTVRRHTGPGGERLARTGATERLNLCRQSLAVCRRSVNTERRHCARSLSLPCRSAWCWNGGVDVLSGQILLRRGNLDRSRLLLPWPARLTRLPGVRPAGRSRLVFFLGQGLLEVSGHAAGPPGGSAMIGSRSATARRARPTGRVTHPGSLV